MRVPLSMMQHQGRGCMGRSWEDNRPRKPAMIHPGPREQPPLKPRDIPSSTRTPQIRIPPSNKTRPPNTKDCNAKVGEDKAASESDEEEEEEKSVAESARDLWREVKRLVVEEPAVTMTIWALVTLSLACSTTHPLVAMLRRTALLVSGIAPPLVALMISVSGQVRKRFWSSRASQKWLKPVPIELLEHVLTNASRDPVSVCEAIDKFCWKVPMLNFGDVKGPIVDKILRTRRPKMVLEFGAHLGYSSVRFATILKTTPGARLISIDPSPMSHAVQAKLLAHAGVSDVVSAVFSTSEDYMRKMAAHKVKFDVVIFNHVQDSYMDNLQLALKLDLFRTGSIIIANNVLSPGCPKYKEFVTSQTQLFDTQVYETLREYSTNTDDEVLVSEYVAVSSPSRRRGVQFVVTK